jgi:hypothetical protein
MIMNPEKILDGILREITAALESMDKAEATEEKLHYSKIVKNLSESFATIIDVSIAIDDEFDDDEEF